MTRPGRAAAALVLAAVIGGPARAAEDDFRPESAAWNGLSGLAALATAAGIRLEARAALDWSAITPDDAVALVYPRAPLDRSRVDAFLAGGGRLLVADDFGAAAPLLAGWGLARSAGREGDALAVAPAVSTDHPLTTGAPALVANRPATLRGAGRALYALGGAPGGAIALEPAAGSGRLLVLSDPSVLINEMLPYGANARFGRNLLGWLAGPDGRRVILVVQARAERGALAAGGARAGLVARLDEAARHVADWALAPRWVRPAGWALAGLALLALLATLPAARRPLEPSFARSAGVAPLPAALALRDAVLDHLADALRVAPPRSPADRLLLLARLDAHAGRPAVVAARRLIGCAARARGGRVDRRLARAAAAALALPVAAATGPADEEST